MKVTTRLGRRWNQDPKPNPSISNYATFANNPIIYTDPFGDTVKYKGLRERIDVGAKRLFDRKFNADFKDKKSQLNTYTYQNEDNNPRLGDATLQSPTTSFMADGMIQANFGTLRDKSKTASDIFNEGDHLFHLEFFEKFLNEYAPDENYNAGCSSDNYNCNKQTADEEDTD